MSRERPIVFVMVGLPGAGKSSAIEKLNAPFFVSSDWQVERLAKKLGKTYNEAFSEVIAEATAEMNRDVSFMYQSGTSFVWDQTNLTVKKRASILRGVPKNYIKTAVFINTPLELAIERNKNRDRTIPEEIIHSMSKHLVKPELEEGFDHVIEFDAFGQITSYWEYDEDGAKVGHIMNRGQHTISMGSE